MQARDAAGRQVSLLNDDARPSSGPLQRPLGFPSAISSSSSSSSAAMSSSLSSVAASSPNTPELMRSASYDSQMSSNEPLSPLTPPSVDFGFGRSASAAAAAASSRSLYALNGDLESGGKAARQHRPAYAHSSRSSSYDDESSTSASAAAASERPGKRYPCRYRDTHGCEKTFTTSGHASRHSKIHTAEKAVQCTFPGCQKKFTRADNMKQHLETHYKDKSRTAGASQRAAQRAALAGARRHSHSHSHASHGPHSPVSHSHAHARSLAAGRRRDAANVGGPCRADSEQYALPSPSDAAWDLRGLNLPLLNRPAGVPRMPSSGLDALAMAIACQEGVGA